MEKIFIPTIDISTIKRELSQKDQEFNYNVRRQCCCEDLHGAKIILDSDLATDSPESNIKCGFYLLFFFGMDILTIFFNFSNNSAVKGLVLRIIT